MKKIAFIALSIALFSVSVLAQSGVVEGIVLNPAGKPARGARVKALFTGGGTGITPSAVTDRKGHFVIRGLHWGEYYLAASKEQDNYPEQDNAFYAGLKSDAPTIHLSPERPMEDVTLHLGRRAGVVIGTITDRQTGEPIVAPCVELRWKSNPAIFYQRGGLVRSNFRLLVPADTDLTFLAWIRGYDPWVYRSQQGTNTLRVGEGEKVRIDIRMKPNGDKSRPPTDAELLQMKNLAETTGCSAPRPSLPDEN